MAWVLGVQRWALFIQAHQDSSSRRATQLRFRRFFQVSQVSQHALGRPSLPSPVASPFLVRLLRLTPVLLVRSLRLTPALLVRPRPWLTSPFLVRSLRLRPTLLVRFLRPALTRRKLCRRWYVHRAAVPKANELVRHRCSVQIDTGECSTVLVGPDRTELETHTPTFKPILEEGACGLPARLGRSAPGMLYFRRIYTDQSYSANATNDDGVAVDYPVDRLGFGERGQTCREQESADRHSVPADHANLSHHRDAATRCCTSSTDSASASPHGIASLVGSRSCGGIRSVCASSPLLFPSPFRRLVSGCC